MSKQPQIPTCDMPLNINEAKCLAVTHLQIVASRIMELDWTSNPYLIEVAVSDMREACDSAQKYTDQFHGLRYEHGAVRSVE